MEIGKEFDLMVLRKTTSDWGSAIGIIWESGN
jgi:hypothetical protein